MYKHELSYKWFVELMHLLLVINHRQRQYSKIYCYTTEEVDEFWGLGNEVPSVSHW